MLKDDVLTQLGMTTNVMWMSKVVVNKNTVQKVAEIIRLLVAGVEPPQKIDYFGVNYNLARFSMNIGEYEIAIKSYGRILEYLKSSTICDDQIMILIELATAFSKKGDIDNAIKISKNGLEIAEKNAENLRDPNKKTELTRMIAQFTEMKEKK